MARHGPSVGMHSRHPDGALNIALYDWSNPYAKRGFSKPHAGQTIVREMARDLIRLDEAFWSDYCAERSKDRHPPAHRPIAGVVCYATGKDRKLTTIGESCPGRTHWQAAAGDGVVTRISRRQDTICSALLVPPPTKSLASSHAENGLAVHVPFGTPLDCPAPSATSLRWTNAHGESRWASTDVARASAKPRSPVRWSPSGWCPVDQCVQANSRSMAFSAPDPG